MRWDMNSEYRLPPVAEDALEVLNEHLPERSETELSKDEAETVLVADNRVPDAEVEYALEKLQSRGHIYYVDGQVRITPTD